jgi:hypothetical protein
MGLPVYSLSDSHSGYTTRCGNSARTTDTSTTSIIIAIPGMPTANASASIPIAPARLICICLTTAHDLDIPDAEKDTIVIWNAGYLTAAQKNRTETLRRFVTAGGRAVVLGTRHWDWSELCDVKIGHTSGSRAFRNEDVNNHSSSVMGSRRTRA